MAQLFSPRADRRLRVGAVLGLLALGLLGGFAFAMARADSTWRVGSYAPQPIPYSHQIHAGQLGLDCRYCHAGVERAASAGMPTAETCLGCHAAVWNVGATFAPLRTALALGTPVEWSSVHRMPDHVRFHHGAHTAAGVACETCHGKVWEMPRTVRSETLHMGWCLDCHRDPAPRQRPSAEAVFDRVTDYSAHVGGPPRDGVGLSSLRVEHFGVEVSPLTRCSTCHR